MKLATFAANGSARLGILLEDRLIDVRASADRAGISAPTDILGVIDGGDEALMQLRMLADGVGEEIDGEAILKLDAVKFLAPIPRPRKDIIGVGLNYRAHVDETNRSLDTKFELPEEPVYFTKLPTSVVGPEEPILLHKAVTGQLDWEAELGVIIGRGGKKIQAAEALDHVFGYTCINDVSARDCRRAGQWFLAKAQDGSAPMGPCVVTADEVGDPQALDIRLSVNGDEKQNGNTALMLFNVAELISDLSQSITLEPGDIIATGTPSGVGYSFDPPQYLNPGDIVEMSIEKIGVLRNPVAAA